MSARVVQWMIHRGVWHVVVEEVFRTIDINDKGAHLRVDQKTPWRRGMWRIWPL